MQTPHIPPDPKPHAINLLTRRLHARARRMGMQPCDADDLVQETLLRFVQRARSVEVQTPDRYALTILHNLARAQWRARVDLEELDTDSASIAPVCDGRLALGALQSAIAALPPEQTQVMDFVLRGETSPRVIAVALGLPVGTVMSRLARARVKLRAQIGLKAGMPVTDLL
jgi:RNA polymerase sigma-70 factor (ECF subfamily)